MADPDDYSNNDWSNDNDWPQSDRFFNLCKNWKYSMTQSQILQMITEVRALKNAYYACWDDLDEQYGKVGDLEYDIEQLQLKSLDDASTLALTKRNYESKISDLLDQINKLIVQRHEDAKSHSAQYAKFNKIIETHRRNYFKETDKLHFHHIKLSRQYDSLYNYCHTKNDECVQLRKENEELRKQNLALRKEQKENEELRKQNLALTKENEELRKLAKP